MKPTYQVKVWPDDDWWLARVIAASDGADSTPLNALTQARSLAKIDSMARDLIATILDADEETFGIDVAYELPGDVNELICQARGAREWADAAQDLWQERSKVAAKALADRGYSLRETATLLGLSHQRVDQLLASHAERGLTHNLVVWYDLHRQCAHSTSPCDARFLVWGVANEQLEAKMRDRLRALAEKLALQFQRDAEAELENADAG